MTNHAVDAYAIERDFRQRVGEQVRLMAEGYNRYRVFTPFILGDGDHLSIVLKQAGNQWVLSDEGHTLMHLTYDIDSRDLMRGNRQKLIDGALTAFEVANEDGQLSLAIRDDSYGDALFSFVQSVLKISDITYLTRERVRSTFLQDFHTLLEQSVPTEQRTFDYHDPQEDPDGRYVVDCRINGSARPLFVFAILNDDRCRDVTITLHWFERKNLVFQSAALFEDQQAISRGVLARFSDVAGKQFSSLAGNQDRIKTFIHEVLVHS
jgi:hypothetical protein